jgi:hypothetical protein
MNDSIAWQAAARRGPLFSPGAIPANTTTLHFTMKDTAMTYDMPVIGWLRNLWRRVLRYVRSPRLDDAMIAKLLLLRECMCDLNKQLVALERALGNVAARAKQRQPETVDAAALESLGSTPEAPHLKPCAAAGGADFTGSVVARQHAQ